MAEPSDKFKDLDYLITRIGMPAVMCGLLIWFLWAKFEKFEDKVMVKLERIQRNTRSIMQKMVLTQSLLTRLVVRTSS